MRDFHQVVINDIGQMVGGHSIDFNRPAYPPDSREFLHPRARHRGQRMSLLGDAHANDEGSTRCGLGIGFLSTI